MNRFFGGTQATGAVFNPSVRPYASAYIPPAVNYSNWANATGTQQIPQPQTMIPNQTNIIWVDSVDQIATYPTGRGWQQWFGDKNEQVLYVRDTDANGVTQPIVKLKYEVLETPVSEQAPVQQVSNAPSREEFNKLSESVNMLVEKLGDLLK